MKKLIPLPREYTAKEGRSMPFRNLCFQLDGKLDTGDAKALIQNKMWNYSDIGLAFDDADESYRISLSSDAVLPDGADAQLFALQGYTISAGVKSCDIRYTERAGLVNALSTFKQLFEKGEGGYFIDCCEISDWPAVGIRSVSNTFAWYAGYGRMGFDMQLWGFEEWKEYLLICSDFKINQFNMCMYGYWPFAFDRYPETMLQNMRMKVWNAESRNWVTISYTHPNLTEEFLSRLIAFGHSLGMRFFAYVGLNSYSGGFAGENRNKRMKLPAGSPYVNDFDRLCLSDGENIEYLKAAMRQIVRLGFDGIDFEESEEAYWYCGCEDCRKNFLDGRTPEEASHIANIKLLKELYGVIREENPACSIAVRAWRQPPLEKPEGVMREMAGSIPDDVGLIWAPGQYVPDSEFEKWASAFGKHRIWGRDTESNAVAACFGRLVRIFRSNGLRCDEESNDQFLEEDIRQHIGSASLGAAGINGYMFEWYGFFLHLFAHAFYGWGAKMEPDEFYRYSIEAVFGAELADDILFVLKNMFVIHESQMKIFPTEFPFARNKVERRDIEKIEKAIEDWPDLMARIDRVQKAVAEDERLRVWEPHFEKLRVSNARCRVIYDLALASIAYDNAETAEQKEFFLKVMLKFNDIDFGIVKKNYFDVNPVDKTGTKTCMIPCHELRRVIMNELDPDHKDDEQIYLGVEALGWLWL